MTRVRASSLLLGLAVAASLLTGSPPDRAAAAPAAPAGRPVVPSAATTAPRDGAGLPTTEVTLVTGDRVLVAPNGADGPPYELRPVARSDGRLPTFSTTWDGDALYVVPGDVAPYVGGLLDRELFNVTALVAMGYDDQGTDELPLVLGSSAGAPPAPAATSVTSTFDQLGLAAARLPKSAAAAFRDDVVDGGLAGLDRVWLDRRSAVPDGTTGGSTGGELDHNLVQIDAPAAWEAGLSGAGVRVAVLDTGVDAEHPDLVGRVAGAANFTESPTTDDLFGNGTHAAALIAGSGAAAEGARRGVAFGADLLNAKVVGDDGFWQDSWVLAGLDWAVDQGADVINIGFNGYPGLATDPVTLAIDELAADTGTTVVVPSGDVFFIEPFTIAAPGAARHALTVGAAAPDDTLAPLSGRGPTYEYGLKPDLLAPGLGIVSAVPGDDVYASRDGTAAAAAHASGAAALVLEQHPDWSTEQVRAALVGNAVELDGLIRDEQGGGRLDLGLAIAEAVVATPPVLDFGLIAFPHDEGAAQTITVTNDSEFEREVTLGLELVGPDGAPAPDGLAALGDGSLTVPPGASASTDLVVAALDLTEAPSGRYEGAVRITGADGVAVTVPVGLYREPERYDLRVRVLDTSGDPYTSGAVEIFNKESFTGGFFPYEELGPDGEVTVRVAPGWYSATSQVTSPDGSLSITAAPEVHVTDDTDVVLDARTARPVGASLDGRPAELVESHMHYSIADEEGRSSYYSFFPPPSAVRDGKIRATPAEAGTHGGFHFVTRWALLTEPSGDDPADLFELVYQETAIPDPPTYVHDPDDTASVQRLDETYRGVGSPSTVRSFRAYASDVIIVGVGQFRPQDLPGRRVEHVLATPGVFWQACLYPHPDAPTQICGRDGAARAGIDRRHRWLDVVHPNPGLLERWDATTLFTQMGLGDGGHHGLSSFEPWASTTLALYDEAGELIEQAEGDFAYFPLAPGPGTYTLEQVAGIAPGHGTAATSATTRWTFHTDEPIGPEFDLPGYLDVGYRPGTDDLGRAEAGHGLRLGLRVPRGNDRSKIAEIVTARAWVSDDEGEHWVGLTLREPDDGHQRFLTRVPRRLVQAGTTLSLRVELVDADGRALEQTLIDAIRSADHDWARLGRVSRAGWGRTPSATARGGCRRAGPSRD